VIERYTLKFSPAVSQEELRKKLEAITDYDPAELDRLHKMKAKIEIVCDFADLRELRSFLEDPMKRHDKESHSPQITTSA
jgi:hypothetical protein